MAIFSVPRDFPTIEKALESPLVQRGDTVLVKEGSYNQVVVVPYNKVGVHVMRDEEPEPVEEPVVQVEEEQVFSEDDPVEDTADESFETDATAELVQAYVEPPREAVTRSSVKVFRVDQGSPYWVTVHRSVLERTPAKHSNSTFWMKLG